MSRASAASAQPAAPDSTAAEGRRALGAGDLLVLATAVLWGASFVVIKSAYAEFTPLSFAATRFVIASFGLLAITALRGERLSFARGDLPRIAGLGLCNVTLYQAFFGIGLGLTTASNSVLLINTAPVMTLLLVAATRADRITRQQALGVLLALGGAGVLLGAGGGLSAGHLAGDILTLLAAASYAVTPVTVLPLYRRYSTLPVMAASMAFGTLLLVLIGLPDLARQSWALSPAGWAQLAYAALGAGALGYLFWYEGIRRIGPTRVAAYSYIIPVLGVWLAVAVLREPFGLRHLLGAAVTITGVGLVRWPQSMK